MQATGWGGKKKKKTMDKDICPEYILEKKIFLGLLKKNPDNSIENNKKLK